MHPRSSFVAATLTIFAVLAIVPATAQKSPWSNGYLPNVPVIAQDGRSLRFYDDVIKGKNVVISFIYTSCRDICPVVTARLAQVEEKLGSAMGRDVFFVSISIDPIKDTPERLKQYAETFQAGPGWLFLTGQPADIDLIRHKLGDRSQKLSEHRNEIWLTNDATGDWARDSVFGDIDTLSMTIRAMDPSWRAQMGKTENSNALASAAVAGVVASHDASTELPGQALFIKTCASCHTVGQGHKVGPDLNGITARRPREWVLSYIVAPEQARLWQEAATYPGVRMPNLGLSENDAADLLAYVEALSYAAAADPKTGPHHHH